MTTMHYLTDRVERDRKGRSIITCGCAWADARAETLIERRGDQSILIRHATEGETDTVLPDLFNAKRTRSLSSVTINGVPLHGAALGAVTSSLV